MTCIAAVVDKGRVWMAADSAGTDGKFSQSIRADLKMFRADRMLIGCCGSFRVRDLIRYKLPSLKFDPAQEDVARFVVTDFVEALRQTLKDGGCCTSNDGKDSFDADLLVAFHGRLFAIYEDFQVEERTDNFSAVGSGSDLALASLYSTAGIKMPPRRRLEKAMAASERFNASVRGPFYFATL